VGEAGVPYIDEFDLAEKLQRVLRDGSLVQAYRNRAQQRIQSLYEWEKVVDQYEQLFARMSGHTIPAVEQTLPKSEPAKMLEDTVASEK
jgi:glycosyltransferase involved in cell wall biosynthesis